MLFANLGKRPQSFYALCQPPVWPDLAKFRHFGKNFQVVDQFLMVYFVFGKNNEPTLANLWQYWANFHCCKWPNIENNLTIWSHCQPPLKLICLQSIQQLHCMLCQAYRVGKYGTIPRHTWAWVGLLSTTNVIEIEGLLFPGFGPMPLSDFTQAL